MWLYYKRVLWAALRDTPSVISSNWIAPIGSAVCFLLVFYLLARRQDAYKQAESWRGKLNAMKYQWGKNIGIGVLVTFGFWVSLYTASLARTIYAEHQGDAQNRLEVLNELNAEFTEGDRNRFSNALADFSDSLADAQKLAQDAALIGGGANTARRAHVMDKERFIDTYKGQFSSMAAPELKYQFAFIAIREKWKMFKEQEDYIFGDKPDEKAAIISNATITYTSFLDSWKAIQNRNDPKLDLLLALQDGDFIRQLKEFIGWHDGCIKRIDEMRVSIH